MHHTSALRIVQLVYDALNRRFEAVVEFFTPGCPVPLRVPVRVAARPDMEHGRLVQVLTREAVRRGTGRI